MIRFNLILLFSLFCLTVSGQPGRREQPKVATEQDKSFVANYQYSIPNYAPVASVTGTVKTPSISLNGTWDFFPKGKSNRKHTIEVPGEWLPQGFVVPDKQYATYKREVHIPADWKGQRILIRFDAVASNCIVRVNGNEVGKFEGIMVPCEFDITDYVQSGTNDLEVDVMAETITDILGCISQYAAHTVGGIIRKVTLFTLPQTHVASINHSVKFDKNYKDAVLTLNYNVRNASSKSSSPTIEVVLTDSKRIKINIKGNNLKAGNIAAKSSVNKQMVVNVPSPDKWDTEHPNLYTLTVNVYEGGRITESFNKRIGFREIELRGNQFFVNNTPIKLHGVNRHEVHPLRGRSLTAELCRQDVLLFRNMANCNYIRTSHYPPSEEFLDACDELGVFVESEAPINWIQHGSSPIWREWNYLDAKYLPYFVDANLRNIEFNRNHPSIILWSLCNESRWSYLWAKVNEIAKKVDTSRPTAFHDQCWGGFNNAGSRADVSNYHYPNENGPAACDTTLDRTTLFGEYGHIETYNRREVITDPYVRADWGRPLARMYKLMYEHKGNLGGAIWSGIDDVFHLPNDIIKGYGPWGVIDAWRRAKPETYGTYKAYAPVIIQNLDNVKVENGKLKLQILNRYDYANLSEVGINYRANGVTGKLNLNAAPGKMADAVIDIPYQPAAGEKLRIEFTDPRGFICQTEEIYIGKQIPVTFTQTAPNKIVKTETSKLITLTIGKVAYTIDKTTGLLDKATVDGLTVMNNGAQLMIVPLNRDDGGAPGIAGNNYQRMVEPLYDTPYTNWKANQVKVVNCNDNSCTIDVKGNYGKDFGGGYTLTFTNTGEVNMKYSYSTTDSVKINPRQWGVTFALDKSMTQLSWKRDGTWSVYPEWAIDRNEGTAFANARNLPYVEETNHIPDGAWADDANVLGSNDFKSTKANIRRYALSNSFGYTFEVISDTSQHGRAWVNDDRIQVLIADFVTGGSDGFFQTHYSKERRPINKGTVLSGEIKWKLY